MNAAKPYAKCLVAAGVAFCATGATAAADGTITGAEWFGIIGGTLAALGAVFGVPNTPGPADADTA